jgi:hypothetical protein
MAEVPHAQFVQADRQHGVHRDTGGGRTGVSGWVGWVVFAGVMMAVLGGLYMVAGLVTLFESHYYEVSTAVLAVDQSWTTLGWTQLILGALAVVAGVALLGGRLWARIVAVAVAGLTVVENFLQMAASPVWSMLLIGLALLAIYAIVVHGREVTRL